MRAPSWVGRQQNPGRFQVSGWRATAPLGRGQRAPEFDSSWTCGAEAWLDLQRPGIYNKHLACLL